MERAAQRTGTGRDDDVGGVQKQEPNGLWQNLLLAGLAAASAIAEALEAASVARSRGHASRWSSVGVARPTRTSTATPAASRRATGRRRWPRRPCCSICCGRCPATLFDVHDRAARGHPASRENHTHDARDVAGDGLRRRWCGGATRRPWRDDATPRSSRTRASPRATSSSSSGRSSGAGTPSRRTSGSA